MKVSVKDIDQTKKKLTVEFDWEEIRDQYDKIFEKLRENLSIKGFRPGKVPVNIAKNILREDVERELSSNIISESMEKIIKDEKLEDYVDIAIGDVTLKEDEGFLFTTEIEFDPEFELPAYKKGFTVVKNNYIISDKEVEAYLDELKENYAQSREKLDGAANGDFIICDIQELGEGGIPILGRKIEDRMIKVGEGIFGQPGAEGLIGAKKGEKVKVRLSDEKGNEKSYEISVKKIEEKIYPELNDEFVEKNFEGVKNLEDLKKKVFEYLNSEWDRKAEEEFEREIVNYFVLNTEMKVPESRINAYLEKLIENIRARSKEEINEDKVREEYRSIAIHDIKWFLIEKKIAEEENITVDAIEVEDTIKKIANNYPEDQRINIINYYRRKDIRNRLEMDLLSQKVMDHIKQFAKVKINKIKVSDLMKRNIQ